jgi:hypothetical protein
MENKLTAVREKKRKQENGYSRSVTFPVHGVAPLDREMPLTTSRQWFNKKIAGLKSRSLEARMRNMAWGGADCPYLVIADPGKKIADNMIGENSFMDCIYHAYAEHRRIILNPDSLWLLICQGFSLHIQQNPDKFRKQLVDFDQKKKLQVDLEEYPLTPEEWEPILVDLQRQIEANTKLGIASLIAAPFSGTDRTTQFAFILSLMNTVRDFFEFQVFLICGIPEITLEGSPEDWEQLEARAEALGKFDLEWWLSALRPVLREFTAAARGEVREEFWRNIFSYDLKPLKCDPGLDKRLVIDGWINCFFPYKVTEDSREAQVF